MLRPAARPTRDLHARAVQQLDAASRGARHEERLAAAHGKAADVERVEAVAVLVVADGVQDALLVDVLGQRQLRALGWRWPWG
jgi:hypothetical protein